MEVEKSFSRLSLLILNTGSSLGEEIQAAFSSSPPLSHAHVYIQDVHSFINSSAATAAAAAGGGISCTPSSSSPSSLSSATSASTSGPPSSSSAAPTTTAAAAAVSPSLASSSTSYDAIVLCGVPAASVDFYSVARALFHVAKPTAFFLLLQQQSTPTDNGESEAAAELRKFRRLLAYSGFVSATPSDMPPMLQSLTSNGSILKSFSLQWCGRKPAWDVGTYQVVSNGVTTTTIPSSSNNNAGVSTGDAELIDESTLIEEDETYIPLGKDRSSCASRPKACANCTCGRKEREEAEERETRRKMLETGELRSSCGSCYLGDAFRCAGCPYRGLPAFKPGQKVSLVTEIPVAPGAQRAPETQQTTTVSVNKVQIVDLADDI